MKAECFNLGWKIRAGVAEPFDAIFAPQGMKGEDVILPMDAMILEKRDENCRSKKQSGFYPAKTYTYTKEFEVPQDWKEGTQILEFEGIMSKAMVFLNGNHIATHKYGYSSLFVDLTPHLLYGKKNILKVISYNTELGSRWYSGSGIYRDVVLWQGGSTCIMPEQLRITTEKIQDSYAVLRLDYPLNHMARQSERLSVIFEIKNKDGAVVRKDEQIVYAEPGMNENLFNRFTVDEPMLWDTENPNLYTVCVLVKEGEKILDICEETFGIRTLELDAKNGLRMNGKATKLRGACIHHDNGIIGATTLYKAEEFRIRKLKEAGFNSIRSAHNPASKALLHACDKWGMLIMDELSDMWNEPKNESDFAFDFAETWKDEIARLVAKDYNHPSVVLYSAGNEIPEIGRQSGAVMNQKLVAELRKKDATRFVTCSISGFLAVADHMGEYAAGMEAAQEQPKERKQDTKESGGSEELNSMMGATERQMMDVFSVSPVLNECIEPVEAQLDVVGYNYLTARHEYEHTLHPDRVIIGSETYPPEIPQLWKIVMRNPYVIGDFSWTGYDYLGEAGIGVYHYDSDRTDQGWYPDRLAYVGDIDINGNRRTISYLREISYGLRKAPYLVVERVEKQGHKVDKNNWKYVDSIHSWTFPGYEGIVTKVHILSGYGEVELFLNDKSLGRKKVGENGEYTATYELAYEAGVLRAVAYEDDRIVAEDLLTTAEAPTKVKMELSDKSLRAGGEDLCFVTIDLMDQADCWSRFEAREVSIQVKGAGSLLGFGSANPSCEGSYQDTKALTYDGRIMAAIRSGMAAGEIEITVEAEGCEPEKCTIKVLPKSDV